MTSERQRIDVWLYRARLAKTRGAAARLVSDGGVRLSHAGQSRRIAKPAAELGVGDILLLPRGGRLAVIEVKAMGDRRGPAAEARGLYVERDAQSFS